MKSPQCFTKSLRWLSALLAVSVLSACGGGGDQGRDPILGLPAAALVSIAVTPSPATVRMNETVQLTATATYADGATKNVTASSTWVSATTAVATINSTSGLATGVALGTSQITATYGGKNASTTLTVTPALLSIAIAPVGPSMSVGDTQQLTVTANFADGSSSIVTSTTTYVSGTPAVATVNASSGLVTGVTTGTSVITGTYGGKSATTTVTVHPPLASITISPLNPSVAVGGIRQFAATANYVGGTSSDISNSVVWASSMNNVATISSTGRATAMAVGTTNISATKGTMSASTTLTVTAVVVPLPGAGIDLGSAANFGVLAGNSITNNSGGTTLVTGDVGSPSQTVDPVQSAGYTNYKSGAELTNALDDLQNAVTDGNSRTCTVNSASGIDLGGLTLPPGVYCYAGAISITGTFTMSGPGVYIFRTASTINTAANSIVALSGASAGSVFWIPVAATTLGANSVFKGTVLAQSGAITMGDNATLQGGRILSGTAVTMRNNQVSIP